MEYVIPPLLFAFVLGAIPRIPRWISLAPAVVVVGWAGLDVLSNPDDPWLALGVIVDVVAAGALVSAAAAGWFMRRCIAHDRPAPSSSRVRGTF